MSEKLISVITPFYNSVEFMDIPYKSMLNQTHQNWEWICVDDCSSDATLAVLKKWAEQDSRIKVIEKLTNGGNAAKTINFGLPYCTGTHVQLLGHDDEFSNDLLSELVKKIEETGADIIIPDAEIVNGECNSELKNIKMVGVLDAESWEKASQNRDLVLSPREACQYSIGWRLHTWACYSLKLLKRCGYNDEDGMNSDEYSARVFLLNANKVVFSKGIYRYLRRLTSISNKFCKKYFDVFQVEEKLQKLIREHSFDKNVIELQNATLLYKYFTYKIQFVIKKQMLPLEDHYEIIKILNQAKGLVIKYCGRKNLYKINIRIFKYKIYFILYQYLSKKLKGKGLI